MGTKMTVYVYTEDLERMRRFYERSLGVNPTDYGDWQPFDLGGARFALHGVKDGEARDLQRYNLSFDVDDIEAAVARFDAQGATVLRGVADEAFGKRAFLQDPDGRTFELVQRDF